MGDYDTYDRKVYHHPDGILKRLKSLEGSQVVMADGEVYTIWSIGLWHKPPLGFTVAEVTLYQHMHPDRLSEILRYNEQFITRVNAAPATKKEVHELLNAWRTRNGRPSIAEDTMSSIVKKVVIEVINN